MISIFKLSQQPSVLQNLQIKIAIDKCFNWFRKNEGYVMDFQMFSDFYVNMADHCWDGHWELFYNNWCIHGLLLSERVVGYLVPLLKLIRKICQICRNGNHLWGRNHITFFTFLCLCIFSGAYFLVYIFLCMFKAASILLILFSACAKLTGEPRYKWQIWALIKLIKFCLFKSLPL